MRPSLRLLNGATTTNGKPSNTAATGSIPATTGAQLTNLTGFMLNDGCGNPAIQFVFSTAALTNASATVVRIAYTAGDSAATVQAAIIAAINGVTTALRITASDGGSNIVTLTNDFGGIHGNIPIGDTTGRSITGMTGGLQVGFTLNGNVEGTPYHWRLQDTGVLLLRSTAGSGVMDITIRIWLYSEHTHAWHPAGVNTTIVNRGVLNSAAAITEDGSDVLTHTETIQFLSGYDFIYAEITVIDGTGTAVDLYLNSNARTAQV